MTALACGGNVKLLEEQMRRFRPKLVAVWTEEKAKELRIKTADLGIPVMSGMDGLIAVATESHAEMVVTAIVGMLGIRPTIAAIREHKNIALANKETLVVAGDLINRLLKESDSKLYPVDSEHGAIWQCLVRA